MTQDEVLKLIKRHYSENFSHLCRDLFPTLLEKPDKFYNILTNSFAPNEFLYDDLVKYEKIDEFKQYIFSLTDNEVSVVSEEVKSPFELLKEVGYTLYVCETEEEIQKFKKYYASGEELCTFRDNRLDRCHVFFAVKDNVDEIKREDFKIPERQDEYGTSVISIQFTKGISNTLSIKNRYNHSVNNPDATFGNNLENIIPGLTYSFNKCFNLKCTNSYSLFEMYNYVQAYDDKYYKFNFEENNIYYCPNNIIIDNFEVFSFDKEKYVVMDNYILDIHKKEIKCYDDRLFDKTADTFGKIDKISNTVDKETKNRKLIINDKCEIILDKLNQIISYKNLEIEHLPQGFLSQNKALSNLETPNVKSIDEHVLYLNKGLKYLDLPNVTEIGDCFLCFNSDLEEVHLPKAVNIGCSFLYNNHFLKGLDLPNVVTIGNEFLHHARSLKYINLPELTAMGSNFLTNASGLKEIFLPKLEVIPDSFIYNGVALESVYLPNVKEIGNNFLNNCKDVKYVNIPKVKKIGYGFMRFNMELESIYLPNCNEIGEYFLETNEKLTDLGLPEVKFIESYFLHQNNSLDRLDLPNLEVMGFSFMDCNNKIKEIFLPNLKVMKSSAFMCNRSITSIDLPKCEEIRDSCLSVNEVINHVNLPNVKKIGYNFLHSNKVLKSISLPNAEEIDYGFMTECNTLESINIPKIKTINKIDLVSQNDFALIHNLVNKKLLKIAMYQNDNLKKINNFKIHKNGLFAKSAARFYRKYVRAPY